MLDVVNIKLEQVNNCSQNSVLFVIKSNFASWLFDYNVVFGCILFFLMFSFDKQKH